MPELPEVEIVVRRLRDGAGEVPPLVGRTITRALVPSTRIVQPAPKQSAARARASLVARLTGAKVTAVRRRAKHILVDVKGPWGQGTLALHLRMTGDLNVVPTPAGAGARGADEALPRFTRLALETKGGWTLAFTDGRHLGTARLLERPEDVVALLEELGPEPLEPGWTAASFAKHLKGARPIKASLLDQKVVAGVGNIYADEALWRAQLHPTRPTSSLTPDEIERLHASIRAALTDSIESLVDAGAVIAWRYQHRESESPFHVYDREGAPCHRCGATLEGSRVAGRATVTCPQCQPAPGRARTRTRGPGARTGPPSRKRPAARR